jgi:hypothetical protein
LHVKANAINDLWWLVPVTWLLKVSLGDLAFNKAGFVYFFVVYAIALGAIECIFSGIVLVSFWHTLVAALILTAVNHQFSEA